MIFLHWRHQLPACLSESHCITTILGSWPSRGRVTLTLGTSFNASVMGEPPMTCSLGRGWHQSQFLERMGTAKEYNFSNTWRRQLCQRSSNYQKFCKHISTKQLDLASFPSFSSTSASAVFHDWERKIAKPSQTLSGTALDETTALAEHGSCPIFPPLPQYGEHL